MSWQGLGGEGSTPDQLETAETDKNDSSVWMEDLDDTVSVGGDMELPGLEPVEVDDIGNSETKA